MADDVTVDNGTLTDYNVRSTEVTGGKQIQHVRLDLGSGTSEDVAVAAVPVSGTVTANLGTVGGLATEATLAALDAKVTAVNTGAVVVSSSALPSGAATFAEQQTQTASLSVLDDWDESDRAKVNTKVSTGTPSVSSVTTVGTSAALTLTSEPAAMLEVSGTYSSISLTFEARAIGGSAYQAVKGWDLFSSVWATSTGGLSNSQRRFYFNTEGFDSIQCRVLSATSGTMNTRWVPINTNGPITQAEVINNITATIASASFVDAFGNSGPSDGAQIGFQDQVLGDFQRQHGSSNAAWVTLRDTAGAAADIATETTLDNMRDKIVATGGSSQVVQGPSAVGASITTGGLFPCGFKDLFNNGVIPTGLDASGVIVMGVLPLDVSLNIQDFAVDGAVYSRVGSSDDSVANSKFLQVNSARQAVVDLRRELTVSYASIDISSSGDNTIVSADATRKIKVLSYSFVCGGTVNVRWKSGAGTNLSGAMSFIANTGMTAGPGTPAGGHLLETAANQALVMNLSGAVQVSGHLSYYLEA